MPLQFASASAYQVGPFSWRSYTRIIGGEHVIFGVAIVAVTAVAEETLINGYLLTRLEQLGWDPRRALLLSLTLRASYHVYYGLGFLLTICSAT